MQPQNENMQIREGANGVFVEGVHETEVRSTEDCLRLLQMGDRNRYTHVCSVCRSSSRLQHVKSSHIVQRIKPAFASHPLCSFAEASKYEDFK